MTDSLEPTNQLKPPAPQRPALPVAGFWARGLAFAADAMLLGAAFYILIFVAKEALFALDQWNMVLCVAIIVAYFTIAEGPLGRGRTVGKFLAGIRIAGDNGQPLTWNASLARTLIKTQVVILQIPIALLMQRLEQSTQLAVPQIFFVLLLSSASILLTLFFAIHIGLSPLKQAPYDILTRAMVFKMDNIVPRQEVIDMYDPPQLYHRLRRAALLWAGVISIGFFLILNWPLLRDHALLDDYIQNERLVLLRQFEVEGLGVPQWPLLSPNPVQFIRLNQEPPPAETTSDSRLPLPPRPEAASAAQPTTFPAMADDKPPQDIKVRMTWTTHETGDVPENIQAELTRLLPELRAWFYPWFYKHFGENTRQANIRGFEVAVERRIPFIVRPYSENILILELSHDPEMAARAEAEYASTQAIEE